MSGKHKVWANQVSYLKQHGVENVEYDVKTRTYKPVNDMRQVPEDQRKYKSVDYRLGVLNKRANKTNKRKTTPRTNTQKQESKSVNIYIPFGSITSKTK